MTTIPDIQDDDGLREGSNRNVLRERIFKLSPKLQCEAGQALVSRMVDDLFANTTFAVMTPRGRLLHLIKEAEMALLRGAE